MSRWLLALVGIGFALAPLRADPKPLWEIDTFPDARGFHPVQWVGFSPDGAGLASAVCLGRRVRPPARVRARPRRAGGDEVGPAARPTSHWYSISHWARSSPEAGQGDYL